MQSNDVDPSALPFAVQAPLAFPPWNFGPLGLWDKKCPQAARTSFADDPTLRKPNAQEMWVGVMSSGLRKQLEGAIFPFQVESPEDTHECTPLRIVPSRSSA